MGSPVGCKAALILADKMDLPIVATRLEISLYPAQKRPAVDLTAVQGLREAPPLASPGEKLSIVAGSSAVRFWWTLRLKKDLASELLY